MLGERSHFKTIFESGHYQPSVAGVLRALEMTHDDEGSLALLLREELFLPCCLLPLSPFCIFYVFSLKLPKRLPTDVDFFSSGRERELLFLFLLYIPQNFLFADLTSPSSFASSLSSSHPSLRRERSARWLGSR
jgi:hypothetical protein